MAAAGCVQGEVYTQSVLSPGLPLPGGAPESVCSPARGHPVSQHVNVSIIVTGVSSEGKETENPYMGVDSNL